MNKLLPQEFKDLIEQNEWIFAKTYAKTAPHEYIVKSKIDKKWHQVMIDFAKYIKKEGNDNLFWDKNYIYYNHKGHKYWTMDQDLDKTDLVNRAVNRSNE